MWCGSRTYPTFESWANGQDRKVDISFTIIVSRQPSRECADLIEIASKNRINLWGFRNQARPLDCRNQISESQLPTHKKVSGSFTGRVDKCSSKLYLVILINQTNQGITSRWSVCVTVTDAMNSNAHVIYSSVSLQILHKYPLNFVVPIPVLIIG